VIPKVISYDRRLLHTIFMFIPTEPGTIYQLMKLNCHLSFVFQAILILFVLIAPCILFSCLHKDFSFIFTSILFALPLVFLLTLLKHQYLKIVILSLACVLSLIEIAMVVDFDNFIVAGNILAILTTTKEESTSFIENNIDLILYYLPILICYIGVLLLWKKSASNYRLSSICLIVSIFLASAFILYKQVGFYNSNLTYRYYIENRVLNRPPYNGPYQIYNISKIQRMRRAIKESNHFSFHSYRENVPSERETYVLAIGESMRYDNISLNGSYFRATTPELESLPNLVSYSDYYSAACLTMFSVPLILTRATPSYYNLNYKEKSIFLPFKENGFKTYGIVCHNLLSYEEYLTAGVDSLFRVEADKDIPVIIDSLSNQYSKTFFIVQFLGCHSYYYNYEPSYDRYHPNINSDSQIKSDSLYINAYDNTILYADHILRSIIRSIDKPQTVASLLFTSDHGENITSTGGGHGGDCAPVKTEYHVPFICWYSDDYSIINPEKIANLKAHREEPVSSDNVFYSVCDMGNIILAKEYSKEEYSVFSGSFETHQRYILVPDGVNIIEVD